MRQMAEQLKPETRSPQNLELVTSKYYSIFENVADVIVVLTTDGTITDLNLRFEEETGYIRKDYIGKKFNESGLLTLTSTAKAHEKFLEGLEGTVQNQVFEVEVIRKDGSKGPYEVHSSYIKEDSQIKCVQAVFRNISSRKQADQDLFEISDFLDSIINAMPDPVFIKNEYHQWVVLNDAFCDFIGKPKELLIGKSDYDFFPKKEAAVFWKMDNRVFTTGQENENTEKFTDASGVTWTIKTRKKLFHHSPANRKFLFGVISVLGNSGQVQKSWKSMGEKLRKLF